MTSSHHTTQLSSGASCASYLSSIFQFPAKEGKIATFDNSQLQHPSVAPAQNPIFDGALGQLMKRFAPLKGISQHQYDTDEQIETRAPPNLDSNSVVLNQSTALTFPPESFTSIQNTASNISNGTSFLDPTIISSLSSTYNNAVTPKIPTIPTKNDLPSTTSSIWPCTPSSAFGASECGAEPSSNSLQGGGGYALSEHQLPAVYGNYSTYFESAVKGMQMACFGQNQNLLNDFYGLSNPLHLALGNGAPDLNFLTSSSSAGSGHSSTDTGHHLQQQQKTNGEFVAADVMAQFAGIGQQQTSHSFHVHQEQHNYNNGNNVKDPQPLTSSSYSTSSSSSLSIVFNGQISKEIIDGRLNNALNPCERSLFLTQQKSSVSNNIQKSSAGGGKAPKSSLKAKSSLGKAKSTNNASASSSSAAAASKSSVKNSYLLSSNCACSNCIKISELEKQGLSIPNKIRVHKCDIPGCFKVYSKSSHLKAHMRWHDDRPPVVQKKRLFDPPNETIQKVN